MDDVWRPRETPMIEPLETIIRIARRMIPLVADPSHGAGGAVEQTSEIDLGEWGSPGVVVLRCAPADDATFRFTRLLAVAIRDGGDPPGAQSGHASFKGRSMLAFSYAGTVHTPGFARHVDGRALVDIETGAVMDIMLHPGAALPV